MESYFLLQFSYAHPHPMTSLVNIWHSHVRNYALKEPHCFSCLKTSVVKVIILFLALYTLTYVLVACMYTFFYLQILTHAPSLSHHSLAPPIADIVVNGGDSVAAVVLRDIEEKKSAVTNNASKSTMIIHASKKVTGQGSCHLFRLETPLWRSTYVVAWQASSVVLGNVSMSAKKFASWFICELKALVLNYHHSLRTSVRGVKTIKYSSTGVCEFLAEMTLYLCVWYAHPCESPPV